MTRESILHDSQQVSEVERLCGLVVLHNVSPEKEVVSCRVVWDDPFSWVARIFLEGRVEWVIGLGKRAATGSNAW